MPHSPKKGIPTVGLYKGAGGLKSETQASFFGGAADQPYDPCYHRSCDTIENINPATFWSITSIEYRGKGWVVCLG